MAENVPFSMPEGYSSSWFTTCQKSRKRRPLFYTVVNVFLISAFSTNFWYCLKLNYM